MLVFAVVMLLLEFAVEEDRKEFESAVTLVSRRLLLQFCRLLALPGVEWSSQNRIVEKNGGFLEPAVNSDKTQTRQSTR